LGINVFLITQTLTTHAQSSYEYTHSHPMNTYAQTLPLKSSIQSPKSSVKWKIKKIKHLVGLCLLRVQSSKVQTAWAVSPLLCRPNQVGSSCAFRRTASASATARRAPWRGMAGIVGRPQLPRALRSVCAPLLHLAFPVRASPGVPSWSCRYLQAKGYSLLVPRWYCMVLVHLDS
jgi:hypothetical protein